MLRLSESRQSKPIKKTFLDYSYKYSLLVKGKRKTIFLSDNEHSLCSPLRHSTSWLWIGAWIVCTTSQLSNYH